MCTEPCQRRLPEAPVHTPTQCIISITTASHMLTQRRLQEALDNSQRPYTMKTLYVNNVTKGDPAIWWKPSMKRKTTANITINSGMPPGTQTRHISFSSWAHGSMCICMHACTCVEAQGWCSESSSVVILFIEAGSLTWTHLALSLSMFRLVILRVAHHTCLAFTWVLMIQTLPHALTTEPSPQTYLSKSYGSKQSDKARKNANMKDIYYENGTGTPLAFSEAIIW